MRNLPNNASRPTKMPSIFPHRSATRDRLLLLLISIIIQLTPLNILVRLFIFRERVPRSLQVVVVCVDCHASIIVLLLMHILLATTFVVSGNKNLKKIVILLSYVFIVISIYEIFDNKAINHLMNKIQNTLNS